MSHFMHRLCVSKSDLEKDWGMLAMPSKGLNDVGSRERLIEFGKIVLKNHPVNIGVGGVGSIYTTTYDGYELLEKLQDGGMVNCVFSDKEAFFSTLKEIIQADLKLCITLQGDIQAIIKECNKIGVKVHTVQQALQRRDLPGPFSRGGIRTTNDILRIVTMCGHGYIGFSLAEKVIKEVTTYKLTPKEGAKALAKFCKCGNFNLTKAEKILQEFCEE